MTDTNQTIGSDSDPLFGGDTATLEVTVTDASDSAFDLSTAASLDFEVFRDALGDGTADLDYDDGDAALSVTGGSNDVVEVALSQSDTQGLAPDRGLTTYHWRVRVTDADGDRDTVATGELIVRAG